MKKILTIVVSGLFIMMVSCGPRNDRQENEQYERNTIPDTEMSGQS